MLQDVKKLSSEYQTKISDDIDKADDIKYDQILDVLKVYREKKNKFWNKIDEDSRVYDSKKYEIDNLNDAEKQAINLIKRKYEQYCISIRSKYIKQSAYEKEHPHEIEEMNAGTVKPHESNTIPNPNLKLGVDIDVNLVEQNIYIDSIIKERIVVPFNKLSNNMTRYFESYARKRIEGKCRNEGYIKLDTANVISYSTGLLSKDNVMYDVLFAVKACFPYENMELSCIVKNITKIGIRAIISETYNPIILFISREHNPDKDFDVYKEDDVIKVKVIGQRFELNDEYISVIGELI